MNFFRIFQTQSREVLLLPQSVLHTFFNATRRMIDHKFARLDHVGDQVELT